MKIKKAIASIILVSLIMQVIITVIPEGALAVENTEEQNKEESQEVEIGREYEIKEEETWDVSINQDGSVMAKWTLEDRTLVISGNGEMRDWKSDDKDIDWHDSKYTDIIEKVIIEEGITSIGEDAFYGCSSLTNIKIPEGVTSIGRYAFRECSSLTNIEMPKGITNIERYVFYECSSLTNIEIPEGVTWIGYEAFWGCSSLVNIEIPEKVENIYGTAFENCNNLENINVDVNNEKYISENGVLFNKEKTKLIRYPEGKKDLDKYIIPEGVTSIEDYVFAGCSSLTNIKIPEGVTYIGSSAFRGCSSLTNIAIPKGVTSIENSAFYGCSSLTNIKIPERVTSIKYGAFYGCSSLTYIEIPEGVTSIEGRVFNGCSNLENINVDVNNEKYISENGILFNKEKTKLIRYPEGKKDLNKYIISDSVTSIEEYAFKGCSRLTNIKISEGVISIKENELRENVFEENVILHIKADSEIHKWAEEKRHPYILDGETKNIETNYQIKEKEIWDISKNEDGSVMAKWTLEDRRLVISGNGEMREWDYVEVIDWHNSKYTKIIEKVVIEEGVTNIGKDAFDGCSSLINIEMPNGVTSIGEKAFSGCSSLTNIEMPNGVTSIGFNAFSGCSSLTNIAIPEGVTSIEESVFEGCSNLKSINVAIDNEKYISENGILFNKEKTKLIRYPEGKKDLDKYIIPEGVTWIGDDVFSRCSSLTNIKIPEGVTWIGNGAFDGCSSLTNIKIPEGVAYIGTAAFDRCSSLKNIEIPEGVTSIGSGAFFGCSSLKNIIIHERVKKIKENAFYEVSNIIVKKNTEGHRYAEEDKIGYIIDEEGPQITYTPNGETQPKKEHQIQVNVEDKKSGVIEESLKYQWTQNTEEPSKESFKESLENGQVITKKDVDGIWYLWIYAKDKLGNETIIRSEEFNLDNTAPSAEVKYSTTELTKENITVTIKANEEIQEVEGWKISEDKRELTKEYAENTEEIVVVKDKAGNQTETKISIKNIDHTLPEIQKGDINEDKKIDITDIMILKRHIISGSKENWKLKGEKLQIADINEDGQVNITDMILLKREIIENL